jgi:hypothetical protein
MVQPMPEEPGYLLDNRANPARLWESRNRGAPAAQVVGLVQRLELLKHRPGLLTQRGLGEKYADCPVAVDEEVGALSPGPAEAAAPRSFCRHPHTEPQPMPSQKPGKKRGGSSAIEQIPVRHVSDSL